MKCEICGMEIKCVKYGHRICEDCEREYLTFQNELDIQKFVRKMGWAFADLYACNQDTKMYALVSDLSICKDRDYKEFITPIIGIPCFIVVKNGKVEAFNLCDEKYKKYTKMLNRVKYDNKKYKYGDLERCTEKYFDITSEIVREKIENYEKSLF